jgi:hypothetical protein
MPFGEPQRSPHQRTDFGQAWPWDRVESDLADYNWRQTLLFVRQLRRRGFDESIYAALGMGGLYLSMSPAWPVNGDVLRVHDQDGKLRLTYLASANRRRHDCFDADYQWDYEYPADQAWPAFIRFLERAHWFAKGHPMLAAELP